jgi:tetratricopeptide (TPR) repeat protein
MYRNAHRLRPGDIYMAYRNVQASLQLHDETLVAYWLQEARNRGADAQWTRRAERDILFARGDFSGLLEQVDQALETLPGHLYFRRLRGTALASLGETDAARDTLRLALESAGYMSGQPLNGSELQPAVELANLLDQQGAAEERDALLDKIEELVKQLQQAEPPVASVSYIAACAASIRNDLPGVLRELKAAVDAGFRNHWELLRDPVFKRWQDNPDFIAFHQGMLEATARMRAEYYVNNPAELTAVAPEGTH